MAEYIEREQVIALFDESRWQGRVCIDAVKEIPAADVAPVVHGHWIKPSTKEWDHYCSVCKGPKPYFHGYGVLDSAFCPNCGAKMGKKESDGLYAP